MIAEEQQEGAGFAGGDEEGGFRIRSGPTRLDKTAGLHRFTWDLRYPGPWQSAARPEGPGGPAAVPGKYSARLTVGSWTATQPFTVVEDPRIVKDGVTTADLQEQFDLLAAMLEEEVSEPRRRKPRAGRRRSKAGRKV